MTIEEIQKSTEFQVFAPKIALYMRSYKLVKEFGEGVDRMLTLSTSVTTRHNSSKLGFVLAAPSVS